MLTLSRERHMLRHRQKDEEAGGEGLGVVCTRKRLWRDADGNIVTKRPRPVNHSDDSTTTLEDLLSEENVGEPEDRRMHHSKDQHQVVESPLSPPPSLASAEARVQDDFFVAPNELQAGFDMPPLMDTGAEAIDFFVDSQWPSQFMEPIPADSNTAAFDDVFNPDTGM